MIPFSAETNQGRDDLAEALMSLIEQPSWRTIAAEESNPEPVDSPAGVSDAVPDTHEDAGA
jgi:hypothetical protein